MIEAIGLILGVSALQFALGALWYSPVLFGKTWMKIMGADHLKKEELQAMQKSMMPFYSLQFVLTFITNLFLFMAMRFLAPSQALGLGLIIWGAFIVPTQISSVIWGSTKKQFWLKQCLIMMSAQALNITIAALLFSESLF